MNLNLNLNFGVYNATFSNISAISWRSVLVVEEAGVPGENDTNLNYYVQSTITLKKRKKNANKSTHNFMFSPGTPASSTTKTDRHDIAEILLNVAFLLLNTILPPKSNRVIVV
jgi:hypothetical protein